MKKIKTLVILSLTYSLLSASFLCASSCQDINLYLRKDCFFLIKKNKKELPPLTMDIGEKRKTSYQRQFLIQKKYAKHCQRIKKAGLPSKKDKYEKNRKKRLRKLRKKNKERKMRLCKQHNLPLSLVRNMSYWSIVSLLDAQNKHIERINRLKKKRVKKFFLAAVFMFVTH